MKPIVILICGATASGKSGLALKLAQRLSSVIISADSRQVYREFDIGTAKPTTAEQELVPHYLIDICEPTETLTLADYQEQAQKIINDREISFLVGGTGLYLNSVAKGLKIPRVAPQAQLRSQLTSLGQVQLHSMLTQVDKVAAHKIHPNDAVRTLRALEVYYVSGKPISAQQGENPPNYPILQIGLDCDVAALDLRIATRTQQMIEQGFVQEVEYLLGKYGQELALFHTLGYAEVKDYLLGKTDLNTAIADTVLHTRQFAKRQRTWFRKEQAINWFDANSETLVADAWQVTQNFLQENS